MAVDVKKLIAAINPDLYCDAKLISEVKSVVRKEGFLKAAEIAKPIEATYLDFIYADFAKSPFDLVGLKSPIEQHRLVYDDSSKSLEQVYFWILDSVNDKYGKSEKLIDNFVASPGSGMFSEFGQKATKMQEEGMKILGAVNVVIKSILNIIYDLKEFKIRLAQYDEYHSKNFQIKNAGHLALKQIWMDNVDIKKGVGSINGLAQQLDFVTIRDAFMAAQSLKDIDKLDLNDRVKRILQQRMGEFELWINESERELRKRFEIEKNYLRSQINTVKLYARWVKPYLKSSRQLEQNLAPNSAIVTAFNTAIFELVLLAQAEYDPKKDIAAGNLPRFYEKLKMRKYSPITIVEFSFRTIPERVEQRGGYGFRGRVELTFTSYALNDEELKVFKEKVAEDDFGEVYNLIESATDKSFAELQKDIEDLLGGDEKEKKKKDESDVNPFSALFSFLKNDSPKKEEKKDLSKGIQKDNEYEKVLRNQAILTARDKCRKLYDNYKKSIGIPAFPNTIGQLNQESL
jgi:hypothetical protein